MLKTFYTGLGGWADRQLPDGTVEWRAPTGHICTTQPGGSIFFPVLAIGTGELALPAHEPAARTSHRRGINEARLAVEAAEHAARIAACNDPPPV